MTLMFWWYSQVAMVTLMFMFWCYEVTVTKASERYDDISLC